MFPIGIDWSEKHLDFCITSNSGDVILRNRVDNDDDGLNNEFGIKRITQLIQNKTNKD